MSTPLTLDEAVLIAFILETLGYGIYLVLFVGCIYVLFFRGKDTRSRRPPVNKVLLTATLLFFVTTTMHWSIAFSRIIDAYVTFLHAPGGPILYFANFANFKYLFKNAVWIAEGTLSDFIMVYRAYVVWGHNPYVVALPFLFTVAAGVSGYIVTWQFSELTLGENIFTSLAGRWIITCFSLTVATNVSCFCLIAYKVWNSTRVQTTNSRFYGSSLMHVVIVIIESAGVWVAFSITTLVLYVAQSNAQFITLEMLSPIGGIVFALIIVRIALGAENNLPTTYGQGSSTRWTEASHVGSRPRYPQAPRQIEINTFTEVGTDGASGKLSDLEEPAAIGTYDRATTAWKN